MTISNQNSKDVYNISAASVKLYTFTFDLTDAGEVFVELFNSAGESEGISWTRVTSPTPALNQYYVDVSNKQVTIGGPSALLQDDYGADIDELVVYRSLALTQDTALSPEVALPADSLELTYDRNVLISQQLQEQIDRSVVSPRNNPAGSPIALPNAETGKTIKWTAGGDFENTDNDVELLDGALSDALRAEAAADAAEASAASINLPPIGIDARKQLRVNDTDDGYILIFEQVPIGTVIMFLGSSEPSLAWLVCDGSAVSRTALDELFALIGTTYGVGDGSTTFNLPDFRSRMPVNLGPGGGGLSARALGDEGGAETHQLTEAELAAHDHAVNTNTTNDGNVTIPGALSYGRATSSGATIGRSDTGDGTNTNLVNDAGGDTAHENMPPFFAINFLIRVFDA